MLTILCSCALSKYPKSQQKYFYMFRIIIHTSRNYLITHYEKRVRNWGDTNGGGAGICRRDLQISTPGIFKLNVRFYVPLELQNRYKGTTCQSRNRDWYNRQKETTCSSRNRDWYFKIDIKERPVHLEFQIGTI